MSNVRSLRSPNLFQISSPLTNLNMNIRHVATLGFVALVSACTSYKPSLPDGYVGPRAAIRDTSVDQSQTRSDLFYISKVDGEAIRNTESATLAANRGRGFSLTPSTLIHAVPARSSKFTVIGVSHYAAPILALTSPVYRIEGVVEFTPQEGKLYAVRGSLSSGTSTVWIEDDTTAQVMGTKVEVLTQK